MKKRNSKERVKTTEKSKWKDPQGKLINKNTTFEIIQMKHSSSLRSRELFFYFLLFFLSLCLLFCIFPKITCKNSTHTKLPG